MKVSITFNLSSSNSVTFLLFRSMYRDNISSVADNFPEDLSSFDCLIVTVDHKQFKIQKKILEKYLKNCKLIIDHDGAWKKYNLKKNYHLSGDNGWI